MDPNASMVGRQHRHRYQNGPAVIYCGSHPCFDQNPRYYRTAITAHLAVIPSFLPFCQQSSPCASVNVSCVYSGYSSLVLKQCSRNLSSTSACSFSWIPTRNGIHIRVTSYPSSPSYLRDFLVRISMSLVR
jgi:hypothetical protein